MSYILLTAIVFALFIFFFGPGYLTYSDATRKADAVVLYVGPGNQARLDEARHLIREGYAGYLIIPSYGVVERVNSEGRMEMISNDKLLSSRILSIRKVVYYKKHYEDTHVETLEAKRLIDTIGVKSVILVSSNYHMRRIKMMADSVFGERRRFVICNPARWQEPYTFRDWFNSERRGNILSEYFKIIWFRVYEVVS